MKVINFVTISKGLLNEKKKDLPDIEFYDATEPDVLEKHLSSAEIIFGNCSLELLDKADNLKWIQIVSSGFDHYRQLENKNVVVTTAKGLHWYPIAEHLLLMMLSFAKNFLLFQEKLTEKTWYRKSSCLSLLSGQKLGIVGFGGIARTLVQFLHPFQMEIQAVTKNPPQGVPEGIKQIYGLEGLETLLRSSDHIVLSLPLTEETKGFLNKDYISVIKEGAFLYNVSRGELIDEYALIQSLQNNHLGGAALDVFAEEPLPDSSPLWQMKNVIITPHIAGHYKELKDKTFKLFCRNLLRFQENRSLQNVANFTKGY